MMWDVSGTEWRARGRTVGEEAAGGGGGGGGGRFCLVPECSSSLSC